MDLDARARLAQTLTTSDEVVARVTRAFFDRHPEWETRYGPVGRRKCTEDARTHLAFLAGAVVAGAPEMFGDYVRWATGMLEARGITAAHLVEHLDLLEAELGLESESRAFVGTFIASARAADATPGAGAQDAAGSWTPFRGPYLDAALAGRRNEAYEVTREALRAGVELKDVYRQIVRANQRQLGELWAAARITVAQEHLASAVAQYVVARLYSDVPRTQAPRGRVMLAGVEGELHVLPAQLAADLLELDGWAVSFVGPNVPDAALLQAIETETPTALGLSSTLTLQLPRTVALVRKVRAKFASLPIVLGGRALANASALGHELDVALDVDGDLVPFRTISTSR